MLITFYCTRCGTHLEIDSQAGHAQVHCENCHRLTRVPAPDADQIPFARLAGTTDQIHPLPPPIPSPMLSYAAAGGPDRYARAQWHDMVAARLENVIDDSTPEAGGSMTSCSYCGTTIAKFIKKCPSCRHPLWGI